MSESVAVLGAGNMGTALAQVIATNGHSVRLWSIEHDVLEEVRDNHLNSRYLEDIRLNERVEAVWEMRAAVEEAQRVAQESAQRHDPKAQENNYLDGQGYGLNLN